MSAAHPGVLRLRVLNVGEGDAIILLLPDSTRAIVVDAFLGERVVEVLEEEGVEEVILFLSHPIQSVRIMPSNSLFSSL